MKQTKHLLVIVAICSFVTSCSFLSPVKVTPKNQYILGLSQKNIIKRKNNHRTLFIAMPDSRPVYNTQAMAYSFYPYEIKYYSRNEWAETPAQLMQNVFLQGLIKSHAFKAVVSSPIASHVDYILNTTIISFDQNFEHKQQSYFELIFNAQLVDPNSNRLVRSHLFSYRVPMINQSPYAGVFAANHAALLAVNDLVDFCR